MRRVDDQAAPGEQDESADPRPPDEVANTVEPGMVVGTTNGDLGKQDVSKPKVTDIVRGPHGQVEKLRWRSSGGEAQVEKLVV